VIIAAQCATGGYGWKCLRNTFGLSERYADTLGCLIDGYVSITKVLQGFDNVISGPKDMRYITEKKPEYSTQFGMRELHYRMALHSCLAKNFPVINQHYLKESINCMLV
jgi:hypothetical protein